MAVELEPMSAVGLNASIQSYFPSVTIVSRFAAKIETPLTNGTPKDVNGVDHVKYVDATGVTHEIYQCVFCGMIYSTPTSVRSHLVKHSPKTQTTVKDIEAVANAVTNGSSIYAPYDTDEENVQFMVRVNRANESAAIRLIRKSKTATARESGKRAVDTDELKTLQAKAKAYDQLKAETLKSKFPV